MRIHIASNNGIPIYLQIINQVKYLVASGQLAPSDELPPIRVLAEQLLINPNTVARAYRDLEQAGVVTSRRGAGTYVSETGSPLSRAERLRLLTERVDGLLVEAHQLKFGVADVIDLVRERALELKTETEER